MHGSKSRHGGALLELHTGSDTFVRPSMGSWILYGLGTENQDLPGYITICPTLTHGGVNAYNSAFLPAVYQGTPLGNASISADRVQIPFIQNAEATPRDLQRLELDLVRAMNQRRLRETGPDKSLEARINSFELAFRMQSAAPELQDISNESEATLRLYGVDGEKTRNFGRQCLMARRFVEQGVRFIQCTHSYKWDQHGGLRAGHEQNASEVDKPIAGLLTDLKQRGLLEETVVLWGGEFGRTSMNEERNGSKFLGRAHHPDCFTVWMAGGGLQHGISYGETDELGYTVAKDPVHVHDLQATILHLLGIDPFTFSYRYQGLDQRLIGPEETPKIVDGILA